MACSSLQSTIHLQVRFRDCDPLKIVWHGNYLKYFEDARDEFLSKHGFSYLSLKALGYVTPIVISHCEHKLPLHYGDNFTVKTTFVPTAAAKMIFKYKITCNGEMVCTGETVQVFLDEKMKLVLNNPPFFLDWKKKMGID